ncbi:hypothetical protein [Cognatitamlana onchidii]|uniref:hypothetical protein n=1 Tax=Cognatitamlana onchidii TaxID=2562860 RepID=UPI0010A64DFC|nr:hypothetical protein [Algibacter onchidii]
MSTTCKLYKHLVAAASSSYSQDLATHLHVGLGINKTIDEAITIWNNSKFLKLHIIEVNKLY